jgi:hypothetical protein
MVFSTYTGAVGSEVYTGRMLINSTGQLIVGNSTGGTLTAALVVTSSGSQPQIQAAYNSGTNGFIVQQTSSAGGVKLYNGDNSELTFGTNNTERMRITSTGNVGINTTSVPTGTMLAIAGGNLTLNGSTSGLINLAAPAVAGTNTISLPAGTGTVAVQNVSTNIVIPGAQISTNTGTATPITLSSSVPSWVRRITINIRSFTTNGSSIPLVRIGPSSGAVATGYLSSGIALSSSVVSATSTVGLPLTGQWAAGISFQGSMILSLIDSATNTWVATGTFGRSDVGGGAITGGSIALSGALSIVTLATTNGTDLFNGGTANILYE